MAERGTTATAIGRPVQLFPSHSMLQGGKAQHPPICTTAVLTLIHWKIARLRNPAAKSHESDDVVPRAVASIGEDRVHRLPPSQPSLPALLGPSRGRRVGSRGIKHQTNGFIHSSRTKREKTTMHCRAIVLGWLLITRHSVTRACRLHSFVACHHQSSPARALLTAFSISIIPTDRPLFDGCVLTAPRP